MKKIRRSFYVTIIGAIVIFSATVYLYIVLFQLFPGNGVVYGSLFVVLLVFLYLFTYVQVRLENIIMQKNTFLIQENVEPPKDITRALDTNRFLKYLVKNGFTLQTKQPSYTVLFQVNVDPVKKIFKKNLLQVIILVNRKQSEFYLDAVDDEIEKITSQLITEKIRVSSIVISQYKIVPSITQKIKNQLLENILLKNKYGLYSVVNIALDESTEKAVFLHSLKFSPGLYYKFHISQILDSL